MNNPEFKRKRYQTDIKSAQGAMAIALVLTLIYIIRAIFSGNLHFYFSLYTVEFFMKFSDFYPELKGTFPKIAAAAVIIAFIGFAVIFTVLSQKKTVFLYGCLALYTFDTVFMLAGKLSGFFSPLAQDDFIDIIVHAFILTFLIIGVIGHTKLKKLNSIQADDPSNKD
ncbi:MAG: hypothetical protein ACI4XE_04415 [Acutalibacteraceae bacterium]